jgi:hypothetical protein
MSTDRHPDQLLGRLLGPTGPELSCDACFDEIDRYVDIEARGGQARADAAIPGMRAHLEGCAACREEHASLRALVAHETTEEPGAT